MDLVMDLSQGVKEKVLSKMTLAGRSRGYHKVETCWGEGRRKKNLEREKGESRSRPVV